MGLCWISTVVDYLNLICKSFHSFAFGRPVEFFYCESCSPFRFVIFIDALHIRAEPKNGNWGSNQYCDTVASGTHFYGGCLRMCCITLGHAGYMPNIKTNKQRSFWEATCMASNNKSSSRKVSNSRLSTAPLGYLTNIFHTKRKLMSGYFPRRKLIR